MSTEMTFCDHVKQHFEFLISEYNFCISKCDEIGDSMSIEYCSDRIYVRILKTIPDFEPRLVLGRIGVDDMQDCRSFDWVDLAELDCCRDWKWQHDDTQPFAGRVVQLARLLRECGSSCLRAECETFVKMNERRNVLRNQHIREEHEHFIRSRVEVAWSNKDYESVATLYSEINSQLSDMEKIRLSYALKRTRG